MFKKVNKIHFTPFTRFNARQTPGVEIHANLLDNLIQDNWVSNPPNSHKILIVIIMAIISVAISASWRPTLTLFYLVLVLIFV